MWTKEQQRVWTAKNRADKKARGECRETGCHQKTDRSRCETHRISHNGRNRKHKVLCKSHARPPKMTQHFRRLARGLCGHCGKTPPRPGRATCEGCAWARKLWGCLGAA